MLPRKTGKPIAFKCTEELRQQTEAIADSLGESLSDYVRKAVAYYNLINSAQNVVLDSTHKNNTASKLEAGMMICDICNKELRPLDAHTGYIDGKLSTTHIDCWNKHFEKEIKAEKKSTIPELKEKVKQMESKQVRTFMKGGK